MINNISPVDIWKDGVTQTATKLLLRVVHDDLYSEAIFYYEMLSTNDEVISNGNLRMADSEYIVWNTSPNATPSAFAWASTKLNLTLS